MSDGPGKAGRWEGSGGGRKERNPRQMLSEIFVAFGKDSGIVAPARSDSLSLPSSGKSSGEPRSFSDDSKPGSREQSGKSRVIRVLGAGTSHEYETVRRELVLQHDRERSA